jgi:hypothetical protein
MDQLVTIMTSDTDLDARMSGFNRFKEITKVRFDGLDNFTAMQWWGQHRNEFVK